MDGVAANWRRTCLPVMQRVACACIRDRELVWLTPCAEKTAKQTTDIILYDQKVVVFKMESDVMLYVVGGPEENEILLYR